MVGTFGCQGHTADSDLSRRQSEPPDLFHGAILQPLITKSVHTSRITPTQMQNPAFVLVKLHVAGDFLQVNSSSQFSIICKLT